MAGLDKIIEKIRADGAAEAAAVIAEAKESAEKLMKDARALTDSESAKAAAAAEKEASGVMMRFESLAETQKKQAFLGAKQDMIAQVLSKAKERILGQEDGAYFAMIEKLLSAQLQPKDGILYFSEKDLARLPEGFAEKAAAAAREAGGTLTVSDEARNIEGGFVLAYGGIEENCSVGALFEERADELMDTVSGILFN